MPKISIITINYNNLEGLKKTISSVANQSWQEFEYIVIDGGSNDGSTDYIESQKEHINYWVSEKDAGIYNAMNKGIQMATGEYLLFLNSGDHFFDAEVMQKGHVSVTDKDIIYFKLNFVDESKSISRQYPDPLLFSHFVYDTLPHPATFIKKQLFEFYGMYDESLKIASDWKFFIECICKHNCTYKRVDAVLSTFYLDGLSSNPNSQDVIKKERELVLNASFSTYLTDFYELQKNSKIVRSLKKSRKIQWLVKLGLLQKF